MSAAMAHDIASRRQLGTGLDSRTQSSLAQGGSMFTLTPSYAEWLEELYRPVAGGDEGDEGGDEGEGEGEGEGDGDEGGEGDGSGGSGDGEGEGDEDGSAAAKVRLELDKTKRELVAAQQAIQKAKKEARDAKVKTAKDNGNWESVAKEAQSELAEVAERATKAEAERDEARTDLDTFKRQVRVSGIATKMGFKDPRDAIMYLKEEDTGDDKTAERALRKLAGEKDYLVDQTRATGRSMNGGGGAGLLTREQIAAMSPAEYAQNAELVSKSLAAMG